MPPVEEEYIELSESEDDTAATVSDKKVNSLSMLLNFGPPVTEEIQNRKYPAKVHPNLLFSATDREKVFLKPYKAERGKWAVCAWLSILCCG